MHWYLLQYGYGSIPINTIFSGMNIHLPAILMFTRGSRFWHTAIWATIFYYILTMLWHSNVSHTTSGTRNASTNRGSTNLKRRKSAAIGTPCSTSMSIFHHLPMKIWAKVQAKAAVDRSLHGVLRYFSLLAQSGYWFWFLGNPSEKNSPLNILWDPMSGKFSHPLLGKNIFRIPSGKRLLAMENHYF